MNKRIYVQANAMKKEILSGDETSEHSAQT